MLASCLHYLVWLMPDPQYLIAALTGKSAWRRIRQRYQFRGASILV
jgi:hypothetical protein